MACSDSGFEKMPGTEPESSSGGDLIFPREFLRRYTICRDVTRGSEVAGFELAGNQFIEFRGTERGSASRPNIFIAPSELIPIRQFHLTRLLQVRDVIAHAREPFFHLHL